MSIDTKCSCSEQILELTNIVEELKNMIWFDSERSTFQKSFFERWRKLGTRIKKFMKSLKKQEQEEDEDEI